MKLGIFQFLNIPTKLAVKLEEIGTHLSQTIATFSSPLWSKNLIKATAKASVTYNAFFLLISTFVVGTQGEICRKTGNQTCTKAVLKKTSRANSSPYDLHFPVCSQTSMLSQPSSNLPASVPSLAATTPS
jgi:hypothetical protein